MQGKEAVGCEQIRQGLTALQTTGAVVGLRFGATLLAEAYDKSREIEEGLAIVTEALRTLDQPGERLWDAELYRLKGELLLNAERGMMNDEFKKTLSSVDVHRSSFIVPRSSFCRGGSRNLLSHGN